VSKHRCTGSEDGKPCPAPAALSFVFTDRRIRPRHWCQLHGAQVREVMRRALKKNAWSEVALEES
jgi:hypothetical protein